MMNERKSVLYDDELSPQCEIALQYCMNTNEIYDSKGQEIPARRLILLP